MKSAKKPDAPDYITLAEFSGTAQPADRIVAAFKYGVAIQQSNASFYLANGSGGCIECHDDGSGFTLLVAGRRQPAETLADAESALYAWLVERFPYLLSRPHTASGPGTCKPLSRGKAAQCRSG